MKFQKTLATVLSGSLVLVLSPAVMAAKGFSYSYADVGYQRTDGDGIDFDSGVVDASFGIFDMFALRAGFRRGNTSDIPGDTLDLTEFRVGGRGHYAVMKKLDIFGDIQAFNAKFNSNQSTFNDAGAIYEAGVRFQAAKKLEVNASYRYVSGDVDDDFGTVGAVFKFTRRFSATANAIFGSEVDEYFAGVRLNF
jgi:opacity protein-like surface antigen